MCDGHPCKHWHELLDKTETKAKELEKSLDEEVAIFSFSCVRTTVRQHGTDFVQAASCLPDWLAHVTPATHLGRPSDCLSCRAALLQSRNVKKTRRRKSFGAVTMRWRCHQSVLKKITPAPNR